MAQTTNSYTNAAILIVDDEISLRNTFRIFLQREGYRTVIPVGSFDEAIQAISNHLFDLILCDIVLEEHSGIELFKRFRKLGVQCPVVIITGHPHIDTAADAVRLGAFDYLPKPVEKETLLRTARLAIQQYHLELAKQEMELANTSYRKFLEALFKSVSDSIICVDHHLNIMKCNGEAKALFKKFAKTCEEGKPLALLCDDTPIEQLPSKVETVLRTGTELLDQRIEWCVAEKDHRMLSICISPLDHRSGGPTGCVLVARDMSCKEPSYSGERKRFHRLIGASAAMQQLYLMIENIGRVDTSVLITGPSGTGKELVVHALHQESPRRDQPLIMVDCTAIHDNLMESELFGHKKGAFTGADENRSGRILQADGGTLFLDEIGDISMNMQLRLLRFLQEKTFYPVGRDKPVQVDVRVIAATNANLKQRVQEGSFREDLFYRLQIIDIKLPPLAARDGDIALLTENFIERFARQLGKGVTGISEQAMTMLNKYGWPGNVRQLEHVIERACVLCPGTTITSEYLPDEIRAAGQEQVIPETTPAMKICPLMNTPPENRVISHTLTDEERQTTEQIIAALIRTGGNKAKAARRLKIDRSTLYRKIRELHIDVDRFSS